MRIGRAVVGLSALAAAAGAAAGWFFSAPRYRGPKSDHFDGRRFHNLARVPEPGAREMVRWILDRDPGKWGSWTVVEQVVPPRHVEGDALRVTWVGHATMLIQTAGLNILTDPIWSTRCSPVSWAGPKRRHAPGVRFEDLPPIDAVVISHNHYDHMDVPTIDRLRRDHSPRFLVPLGNARMVRGATELDWWQSAGLTPDVRVHAVPAQHFSSRGLADRNANLWSGYVIETPGGNVFFAGDTGWGPHFERIRERFGRVRLAILPVGAYRPRYIMAPVHISPREAIRAARALGATSTIPMHYFTFRLGDDGQSEPADVLRREGAEAAGFVLLPPGGVWDAPGPATAGDVR